MPHKVHNMQVDILPTEDNTYYLGDSTHRWIINGENIQAITNNYIDDMIDEIFPEQQVMVDPTTLTAIDDATIDELIRNM